MRPTDVLLVLVSVALSSSSQIMLERGMTGDEIRAAMDRGEPTGIFTAIVGAPLVWAGLFCFGLSAVVWLFVLSRIPLSRAYPFVALGIVVTVAAGVLAFREPLGATSMLGVALIVTGVLLIGVRA